MSLPSIVAVIIGVTGCRVKSFAPSKFLEIQGFFDIYMIVEIFREMWLRLCIAVLAWVIMLAGPGISPVSADIYRHVDDNGVVHFTNAPQFTKVTNKQDW